MESVRIATAIAASALSAALLLIPVPGRGQDDEKAKAKAAVKAKQKAANFENKATVITFYDRRGKAIGTVGERALYDEVVLSPDRTRIAVIKEDQETQSADLWVMDAATGKSTRITTSARGEFVYRSVWSPDGRQLAYVTMRGGSEGVYRRASNGEGPEELLYKNPAIFLMLSDWSLDGRFLSFAANVSGGVLYILPLTGEGERKPIEVYRSEGGMFGPRFSPDGRFLAYVLAREGHRNEVFVRPIDASAGTGSWQVSEGSRGSAAAGFQDSATLVSWRRDGKELRYLGPDLSVMAVAIGTSPTFKFGRPKVLFRPPGAVPIFIGDISRDGERFIALPPPKGPQLQQITVFDREGKIVSKVGVPGLYAQPAFSPDGTRLVVMREDLATGNRDIWTFDVATGKGTQVTNDLLGENTPIWSLDGTQILFVSKRGGYSGVYRRPWDGTGSEELLFRYTPGAGLGLTDVSPDGKFLVCGSGGVVLVVALTGTDPVTRKALEFSREEFDVAVGRISPDGLFMAFRSDEANPERGEVYVRPFDASTGGASEGKWRVSKDGVAAVNDWSLGNAMLHWRRDGKELFFRGFNEPGSDDLRVMSVDVATTPAFQAGTPKLLFKLPGPQSGSLGSISRDGQRFVFALNVPAATTAN